MARRRARRNRVLPWHWAVMGALAVCCVLLLVTQPGGIWQEKGDSAAALDLMPSGETSPLPLLASRDGQSALRENVKVDIGIYDHKNGEVTQMDLEDYVLCVIAGEMPLSSDIEALKAQAVAARSYIAYQMRALGGSGCSQHPDADVCTQSNHCMAYRSIQTLKDSWGSSYEDNYMKLKAAVDQTRGLIMVYQGEPIHALFHAVSGGMTEDVQSVFSMDLSYLKAVDSPGEEGANRYFTQIPYTYKELAQALNKAFPEAKLSADKLKSQIAIISRSESGRIEEIKLGAVKTTGTKLRAALGLNSTNVTFDFAKGAVVLSVTGFGHGVGLSQAGAQAMAQSGSSYEAILLHYYQGVQLTPIAALL